MLTFAATRCRPSMSALLPAGLLALLCATPFSIAGEPAEKPAASAEGKSGDAVLKGYHLERGLRIPRVNGDASGLTFCAKTRSLFLVINGACQIVESTEEGKEVGRLPLLAGSAGLSETVPQAEGLALDDQGTLYVCSEPNLLYIFKKPKPATNK